MDPTRRALIAAMSIPFLPLRAHATEDELRAWVYALQATEIEVFVEAIQAIEARGGTDLISSLILAIRFSVAPQEIFLSVLASLAGETRQSWHQWMLWQEAHPEIASHPIYREFKRDMFLRIDPEFAVFLQPEHLRPEAMKIRFEEITWGGVVKDGIPSLDNPTLIAADEADYLKPDDLVFGVSINGDARAYPLRIMGWHEMFNDVIGGVPVALAYCTLCGAGILFETSLPARSEPFVFGSSGFLYRSNKLMFDRQTHSLWNQFTGSPVSGALVESGIELKQRPVVITEWQDWRRENPATRALSRDTGYRRNYSSGFVYNDYFASPDLMFPALVDQSDLRQKDYVFGIRTAGGARAWPLEAFRTAPVINDQVGFTDIVLIGDADTRSVRAYERGPREFDAELSAGGQQWTAGEEALIGADGTALPRVAGHISYWFAWDGYLGADASLYGRD